MGDSTKSSRKVGIYIRVTTEEYEFLRKLTVKRIKETGKPVSISEYVYSVVQLVVG